MSAADVLCLASSSEGWPNVVHEALSCGLPVVATNVGAVPEMIPSDQFGLVVPVGDVPALTEALALALQKPWQRAAIAAWGNSRSWDQVAREALEQMQAAAGGSARQRMV
jgi:glycosyltransferase involved in cell wall biosynthesis